MMAAFVGESCWVLVPMMATEAPGPREMGVPETVMAPPGDRVCDAMTNSEVLSAVYVDPANVKTGVIGFVTGGAASC